MDVRKIYIHIYIDEFLNRPRVRINFRKKRLESRDLDSRAGRYREIRNRGIIKTRVVSVSEREWFSSYLFS